MSGKPIDTDFYTGWEGKTIKKITANDAPASIRAIRIIFTDGTICKIRAIRDKLCVKTLISK